MKKSNFMLSSKDMLLRSFNPSKCKTSLRLTGSRLKLLRNKKEVQVKQIRKEIAQLLESGQDQTARIRVEHVVREEKTIAAYDLIQIYCELIIARLPIIESQKVCPIDLKEAVASIIFASPRCGDVPELSDVKKQFTTKYGKDFATAAIEVRPACDVSRMLIEKLSATAPDGPTKVKILTGIAEEYNVQWDHKSFDEIDPPMDTLSGPSTFGSESQPYIQPSRYAYQDVQVPSATTVHGSQSNSSYQDTKPPPKADNHAPAQDLSSSVSFQDKERPPDRQHNWPMEFKDATSAAMAAAESAKRASMAAKAAAEFANAGKITRQYSTESRKSEIYLLKVEEPELYLSARNTTDHISETHIDRLYSERTRLPKEQTDNINANRTKRDENFEEYDRGVKTVYSQSGSLKSKALIDEDLLDRGVPAVKGHSRKNSLKEDLRGEIRSNKQPFKPDPGSRSEWPEKRENIREEHIRKQPSVKSYRSSSNKQPFKPDPGSRSEWPEKRENIREEHIRKQPSVKSYRSGSSVSDEVNVFANTEHPTFGYDTDNDSAVKGDVHEEDLLTSVHFDKFDSDGDDHHHGFDIGPRFDEPIQKSTRQPSINSGVGPGSSKTVKSSSSSFFTENLNSVNDLEEDTFKPVTFDDSDGPVSDIEEETNMYKGIGIRNSSDYLSEYDRHEQLKDEHRSPIKEKRYSGLHKEHMSVSSDEESMYMGRSQGNNLYADSPKKFSLKNSSGDLVEPNDFSDESDTGEGLNLVEKLRDGLRHTGYKHPPYSNSQLDRSSSPKEEITSNTIRPTIHSSVESPKMSEVVDRRNRIIPPATESDSDSDSSIEEMSLRKSSIRKPNIQERRSRIEIKPKLSLGSSYSIFGSDESDLVVDKELFSKKTHSHGGLSQRTTKASPKSPETSTYSKTDLGSEALDSNGGMDRKPTNSYISDEFDSKNKHESFEQPTSAKLGSKPARSNYWGPPEQLYSPKTSSVTKPESTERVKYEKRDPDDIGERKSKPYTLRTERESASKTNNSTFLRTPEPVNSGKTTDREESSNTESPKAPSNKTLSSTGDGSKRAGHVHPKLPDYDFLVQSLRNRS